MIIEDFSVQSNCLGSGGYGNVFKGKNLKTGEKVAIKMIDISCTKNRNSYEAEKQVFHVKPKNLQNVVDIYGVFQQNDYGFIVMKKYDCDLFSISFEENNEELLPEIIVKTIFRKICIGLKNLHHQGIAHLDIKPENILIDRTTMEPYICDFGNSFTSSTPKREEPKAKVVPALGYRGTRRYSSPEMDTSPFAYDPFSADVYSLGVVLHILLVGAYPKIIAGSLIVPTDISGNCTDFLKSLLNDNPFKRCRIDDVLQHPYLNSI